MTTHEYHRKDDVLVVQKDSYDNYGRSVEVANFVLDFDTDGNFLGLEVLGASERLPLSSEELEEVEKAEIEVVGEEENSMITVLITRGQEKTSLNLPVKAVKAPA